VTCATSLRWSSNLTCPVGLKKRDFELPRFIFLTDERRVTNPVAVARSMPTNSAIIIRGKNLDILKPQIAAVQPVCASRGLTLLATVSPEMAVSLGLDGIHLSEAQVRRSGGAVSRFAENWVVTAAAHTVTAVRRARKLGVDRILISPVFSTVSHTGANTLGVMGYRKLAKHAPSLACPLGGITPRTLTSLKGAPIAGIAGIEVFLDQAGLTG